MVDARDVALAFANAVDRGAAIDGKTLMIAGDETCVLRQQDMMDDIMQAVGIGRLGPSAGLPGDPDDDQGWVLTDWFDTSEAEALLEFQQHTWSQTLDDIAASTGRRRLVNRAIGPIVRPLMRRGFALPTSTRGPRPVRRPVGADRGDVRTLGPRRDHPLAIDQHCAVGGFAERLLVGHHNVVRVDPALPLEHACLLGCGVMTGAGAVLNTSPVRPGASVAVLGCGGVGLAAIQAARLAYAGEIVAVDVDDAKLELARRCGATRLVDARRDDPVAVAAALPGGGVDNAYEAIGRGETAQQALAMTAAFGTCTVVGILPLSDQISVAAMDLMMGKTLRQSVMGSARPTVDIPLLADHALAGRLDLAAMVDGTRSLDDLPGAIDDLAAGRVVGRTVVTF